LAHPFPLAVLAATTLLVGPGIVLRRLFGAPHAVRRDVLLRLVTFGTEAAAVAVALVAPWSRFYLELGGPVSFAPSVSRLSLVFDWAWREWPALGALPLVAGAVIPLLVRRVRSRGGGRWAAWNLGLLIVSLGTVLVTGGHPSYATRGLYALPFVSASLLGLVLANAVDRTGGSWAVRRVSCGVLAAALVAVSVIAYQSRLDTAVPYYNTVTPPELAAIRTLAGVDGAVAVTSKGDDQDAGTLYSWVIEGIDNVRAFGSGQHYIYLLRKAELESWDAERFVAGDRVLERGALRVGSTDGAGIVDVSVFREGSWYPVLSFRATPPPADGSAALRSAVFDAVRRSSQGPRGVTFRVGLTDVANGVRVAFADRSARPVGTGTAFRVVQRTAVGPTTTHMRVEDAATDTTNGVSGGAEILIAPGAGGAVEISIAGTSPRPPVTAEFDDLSLVKARNFSHVFTWNVSPAAERLNARTCLERTLVNAEISVFRVDRACMESQRK
jgi:hypothetical protein